MSEILGYKLTQTGYQVQQILDRSDDAIVDDAGVIKVIADEYYGDGSHLTGIQASSKHNDLEDIQGGITGLTNDEYYHLTSSEYNNVKGNALNLKAMQFVGICKRCNFQPTDIVIDSVINTITIPTVNGIIISESNPLRYFTDGDGLIHEHVVTTPVSASFTNTSGVWYVHFDVNSNFICTQIPWSDFDLIAPVYRFFLNTTLSNSEKIVVRAYEGHLNVMSAENHAWLHSQGTVHLNGFDLVHNTLPITALGVPTISPNADGRNAVISITQGRNSDDGLEYTVTHSTNPILPFSQNLGEQSAIALNSTNSGLFKTRTNDVNGLLYFLPASRFPFAFNSTTNIPQYITSTGVRTDVSDNQWFVYYVYALQDDKPTEPIKLVSAEQSFTTYALAQTHDWINLQALYATLRDKEIRPLYKLIFYCNSTQGGSYDVATKYSALASYVDIRTYKTQNVNASSSSSSVLASNVIVTPSNGFVSIDQQSFDNEIASKFNTHTGQTNPHLTKFSDLITTAHTHQISDVSNLQTTLNGKLNLTGGTITGNLTAVTYYGDGSHLTGIVAGVDIEDFNAHTGDTSIHFTKNSINISDINSAHTHGISEVLNLQTSLNNKTDLTLFSTHTGQTNPHLTKFSDLIVTAHTHTIADVSNLQTSLNGKLSLTGGTMTGTLIGTTISASTYQGIKASHVANDSTNVTGANLKVVLDNATLAIDGVSIQDTDLFPISREVQSGATFVSTNMYHSWDRIKDEIKSTCGTYYIDTFAEFKTIVEDPLTPADNITFYLSNGDVFIMSGEITGHTENIYVKSQNTNTFLGDLTINTTLVATPNRIYFDGVVIVPDSVITISLPSDTTSFHVKELVCDELYPADLSILTAGLGSFQYNNATNVSRSRIQNDYQYALWDAIRQDEKWAYSHYRTGAGLDLVGKTIAKVTGISDAYGNFSIKVRYRLCYNEVDLVLPLFPATLPHGKWVRFETCDFCRDKARGEGGIYVSTRGFEVAKFYKGDSDLVVTNGSLSNEAGAGGLYENQYDDNNTYFSSVVRSTLAQSTLKVKYTDSVSTDDNDTWVIVHLRGVIL